jgi:phosphopantothenoylcysteine decarboxylase/phosphopantothenate--cysteine ligase
MLQGKKILITAGPTYEKIDPVRFIGNFSTGKMGYALAQACADLGGEVKLVSGPTALSISHVNIERIDVMSAQEMYEASMGLFPVMDIAILCAAVADYTPKAPSLTKVKSKTEELTIQLVKNKDIAAALGRIKTPQQTMIGFALETNNEVENAQKKLASKNLDYIILNSLQDDKAGFGYDTNKVTIISVDHIKPLPLMTKSDVAGEIVALLE